MKTEFDFTRGKILGPLMRFVVPVLLALILQSLYGAVDLWVVGRFGTNADVSAVSTGSQLMHTLTGLVSSFAVGITVLIGQNLGEGRRDKCAETVGTGIVMFLCGSLVLSVLLPLLSSPLVSLMNAPEEAHTLSARYVAICGAGTVVITAYNLIGSIFRGLGDSATPLITVGIACVCNIIGDVLLAGVCKWGAVGAAVATVAAQLVSVLISLLFIRKKGLPFPFTRRDIRADRHCAARITGLGLPIAFQELLVQISFLVLLAIVNSLGLIISAGVGVSEKVCAFIMLIPASFGQAMAAFTAQNIGAGRYDRAKKGLFGAVAVSVCFGILMFYANFFHGDLFAGIFTSDPGTVATAWEYLRAYAVDCLLTCFLFCSVGFFNGLGYTRFVMWQGIIGAFGVRIPVAFLMSRQVPVSLFRIGLATPCSTAVQILLLLICYKKAQREFGGGNG